MNIAIVGAGVSGLHAASCLHKLGHHITVFEANKTIGGHIQTVRVPFEKEGQQHEAIVDMGVFMFDPIAIHPYVYSLINKNDLTEIPLDFTIQIKHHNELSFFFKTDYTKHTRSNINLLADNLGKMIAFNGWLNPKGYWTCIKNAGLIKEIFKFHFLLENLGKNPDYKLLNLHDFIKKFGFSDRLVETWILPQLQCWWGSTRETLLESSIQSFSDSVFKVSQHAQYTFTKGVDTLIQILSEPIQDKIKTATPIKEIIRTSDSVMINNTAFDAVLLAVTPSVALKILQPDSQESEILNLYDTTMTTVLLHTDAQSWLPARQNWSLINLMQDNENIVSTFWVGGLHALTPNLFLTWGDKPPKIDSHKILKTAHFLRTLPTLNTIQASEKIHSLQGKNRTWYCGAHVHALGHAPHSLWADNALQSGLQAAEAIHQGLNELTR